MGRSRNMPTRDALFQYWKDLLPTAIDSNTCFKCNYTNSNRIAVDRAHILPVGLGGSDELSNIHLLCSNCHKDSECYYGDSYNFWLTYKGSKFGIDLGYEFYLGNVKFDMEDEDEAKLVSSLLALKEYMIGSKSILWFNNHINKNRYNERFKN